MLFEKVVTNVSTLLDLKRVASAYVIDYRALSESEIKEALVKTAPQYYYIENLKKTIKTVFSSEDRRLRIIAPYYIKYVILQKNDFVVPRRDAEQEILAWEQSTIDDANEKLLLSVPEKSKSLEFFRYVLESAWENDKQISLDEFNLIEKIRNKLKVTTTEHRMLEAKLGIFPTKGNVLHSRSDIEDIRKILQSYGLLFSIRNEDGIDFDVMPDEVARAVRQLLNIEIKRYGYSQLIKHKYVRSKSYSLDILTKCGIPTDKYAKLEDMQCIIADQVSPKILLGGISPRDGLSSDVLSQWCRELGLNISGQKPELIDRLICFYDDLRERSVDVEDDREGLYVHYEDLAFRRITELRSQLVIEKDIEIERKFEDVTNYIFEQKLGHKPLSQVGTNHADGALSYKDKIIYWDNKSKETPVNLKDHLKQFDGYIRESEKSVAGFLVIGPEFTLESSISAMQYQVENSVSITLITAEELKSLAEKWSSSNSKSTGTSFNLGYLLQSGRFNPILVP